MANAKYKTIFEDIITNHIEDFKELKSLGAEYKKNPKKFNDPFKEIQRKVLLTTRKAENRLCAKTENTKFSDFSTGLAEKFWEEVRAKFPEIDYD